VNEEPNAAASAWPAVALLALFPGGPGCWSCTRWRWRRSWSKDDVLKDPRASQGVMSNEYLQVREIYEMAVEAEPPYSLSDADCKTMCVRYANLETRVRL